MAGYIADMTIVRVCLCAVRC